MKKITILWLVGISAFALQCLLVGLSFASVCPMSAVISFGCGLLPLVFVPVLCPLIYRHGVKVWNRRRIYPPWNLISWGVIIAGQVCLACINFFRFDLGRRLVFVRLFSLCGNFVADESPLHCRGHVLSGTDLLDVRKAFPVCSARRSRKQRRYVRLVLSEKTPFFVNGVFLLSNWNNALI